MYSINKNYIYYIPKANYIGKTLCERLVKRRVTMSDIYADGLKIRKKEHVRNGKMKLEDEILPICITYDTDDAYMLEQMLIRDFDHLISNEPYILLGDEKYESYKEQIDKDKLYNYEKIKKKLKKHLDLDREYEWIEDKDKDRLIKVIVEKD